jgi:hypothetical protein
MKWTTKKSFDITTHVACEGDWTFVADKPYSRTWVLRGWLNNQFSVYREYNTLKDAKAAAALIAGGEL